VVLTLKLSREVARPGRDVQHHAVVGQTKVNHRSATPAPIETEGHEFVHEFVARRDRVEHRSNVLSFRVALGEGSSRQRFNDKGE
jgi:hypothetical protein